MKGKKKNSRARPLRVVGDYDAVDTSVMVNPLKSLKFEDIGLRLPAVPPTQVISVRLPSSLLNELRAISSETDIPYQALIKLLLSQSVSKLRKKS